MESLTDAEIAYVAGFLDGEGCLSLLNSKNRCGRYHDYGVYISNNVEAPLVFIQKRYGGTLTRNKHRHHRLQIKARPQIQRLLRDVLPYLLVKRKQAELMLEFLHLKEVSPHGKGVRSPYMDHFDELMRQLKTFNVKVAP